MYLRIILLRLPPRLLNVVLVLDDELVLAGVLLFEVLVGSLELGVSETDLVDVLLETELHSSEGLEFDLLVLDDGCFDVVGVLEVTGAEEALLVYLGYLLLEDVEVVFELLVLSPTSDLGD